MIEHGLSLTKLITMISSCFGEEISGKRLKYSLKFDPSQLIDLIDDDGVKQLIKYNEGCAQYANQHKDMEFVKAMGNLRSLSVDLARWVETQSDVDKWAMSGFLFRRWDNITTNLAESFNAWLVKERRDNVQYQCSRCHQSGHNRASCTNPNPTEL
ncbi:hypothetical protein K1719_020418 [Acacia pycnantha]|nr:hypothetical protein K1719_020418 [Acacia pycnantha]